MRTIIIGGTFNPVHNGHLYISEEIRKQLDYQRILFIPSNIPPHKEINEKVTPEQRLTMLNLALVNNSAYVDDCEISRGGKSYTIYTIDSIYERYKVTGKLGLMIGDDLLEQFKLWHRWKDLLERVDLIVVHRNFTEEKNIDLKYNYLKNLILPISSQDIRKRIKNGYAFRYLLPENVYSFITDNRLYLE